MNQIDWKRKLSFRKLWAAIAGIVAFSQRTLIDDGNVFFIAVAQGEKPKGRIFFDMAHELGHILLHPKSRENQANRFASAFLLPKESFLQEIQAYPTDLNYYLH